jgi:hypothetical protein
MKKRESEFDMREREFGRRELEFNLAVKKLECQLVEVRLELSESQKEFGFMERDLKRKIDNLRHELKLERMKNGIEGASSDTTQTDRESPKAERHDRTPRKTSTEARVTARSLSQSSDGEQTKKKEKEKEKEEESEDEKVKVKKSKVVRKSNNIKKGKMSLDQKMKERYQLPKDEYTTDKDYHDYMPNMIISEEEVLDNKEDVHAIIYCIECEDTNKLYIGRTTTHRHYAGKYTKHSAKVRLEEHIKRALNNENDSPHLANDIRKYGPNSFSVEEIGYCLTEDAEYWETKAIRMFDTLFPNGYNNQLGGKFVDYTIQRQETLSKRVSEHNDRKRIETYKDSMIPADVDVIAFIKPLSRGNANKKLIQYGYYIYYTPPEGKKIKTDFGGAYIPLEFSLERAIQFGKYLQIPPKERKDILPKDIDVDKSEIERYYQMYGGGKAQ